MFFINHFCLLLVFVYYLCSVRFLLLVLSLNVSATYCLERLVSVILCVEKDATLYALAVTFWLTHVASTIRLNTVLELRLTH